MPKIQITANFEVRYVRTVTKSELKRLESGEDVRDVIGDEEALEKLGTEGDDAEMEWEEVETKPRKKNHK